MFPSDYDVVTWAKKKVCQMWVFSNKKLEVFPGKNNVKPKDHQ